MKNFKTLSTAVFCAILCLAMGAFTQKVQAQSTIDKISDYFSSDDGKTQQVYSSGNGKKVSVTVQDLSWSDTQALSGSIFSAFKGTEDLAVEDIVFAPDFEQGHFFLSFNTPDEEQTKVVILDVRGREIHNETIEGFSGTYESQVNIPSNASGTYFLKIVQGFSLLNKKLIIE